MQRGHFPRPPLHGHYEGATPWPLRGGHSMATTRGPLHGHYEGATTRGPLHGHYEGATPWPLQGGHSMATTRGPLHGHYSTATTRGPLGHYKGITLHSHYKEATLHGYYEGAQGKGFHSLPRTCQVTLHVFQQQFIPIHVHISLEVQHSYQCSLTR